MQKQLISNNSAERNYIVMFYLTHATTPVQSGSRSDGNEGALHIPQSSTITEAAPSYCLVSYTGYSLRVNLLQKCNRCILQPQLTGPSSISTVRFSISTQFSSIWPIDRILWGATAPV